MYLPKPVTDKLASLSRVEVWVPTKQQVVSGLELGADMASVASGVALSRGNVQASAVLGITSVGLELMSDTLEGDFSDTAIDVATDAMRDKALERIATPKQIGVIQAIAETAEAIGERTDDAKKREVEREAEPDK